MRYVLCILMTYFVQTQSWEPWLYNSISLNLHCYKPSAVLFLGFGFWSFFFLILHWVKFLRMHMRQAYSGYLKKQYILYKCFPNVVKNLPAIQETQKTDSIPGSGRAPGGGNGNPFQYSCLKNPVGRGAWWATDQRVMKSWTQLSDRVLTV